MSLVVGEGVGKSYGDFDVFKNFKFSIERQDRIGLVGANGEGKTTFLRLLVGLESPSAGTIAPMGGLEVGYLAQDPPDMGATTLWQEMLEVFATVRQLEGELGQLARELEEPSCPDGVLERYSRMQAQFEHLDGYSYENRIRSVLTGLGFRQDDFGAPLNQLSGGQRTRAYLGKLLLAQPDLLLLDEPTNHLDLQAVEWLENWLAEYKGSILLVSHDRYFLDRVTNRTWEIAFGGLEAYRGNYSAYVRQREERFVRRMKEWQAQQEYIAKTEEFIRKYIAGQRTKEAQGRRTRLERFMAREAVEKPRRHAPIRVRLIPPKRSGDIVLRFERVVVGYRAEEPLVHLPPLEVRRGERIALVGPNGAGKTTLVRSILGELKLLDGNIRLGASVEPGYLAQAHDYLKGGVSALEAVRQVAPQMEPQRIRSLLGSLLFSGDDVFKPIAQLSGGQRSRVALARLAVQESNLLVLDEPTNHLDIASQEVLQDLLANFAGTLILVSHDRYLIQAVATHIWRVDQGKLDSFKGNWDEFLSWRAAQEEVVESPRQERRAQREEQRQARRQRKLREQAQVRQEQLETEIHILEGQLAELSQQISSAGEAQDMEAVHQLGGEYRQIEGQMGQLWEELEQVAQVAEAN